MSPKSFFHFILFLTPINQSQIKYDRQNITITRLNQDGGRNTKNKIKGPIRVKQPVHYKIKKRESETIRVLEK